MPSVKDCLPVFQTWHPTTEIKQEDILASVHFDRPLISFDALDHINAIKASMETAHNRIWFCGSYLGGGIPLLEAGVRSSLKVANKLGIHTPW
jgi:predicted NAD/FAD-binding protein